MTQRPGSHITSAFHGSKSEQPFVRPSNDRSVESLPNSDDALLHWLSATNPEGAINRAMRRFVRAANLTSPRTQRPMMINPRRFRFSIATHMAEEGASAFHIAEVLDHTDTQNVRVYVETVS